VRRHLQLARLYQQHELFADAESELQTVINLDPDSPDARQARDLLPQVTQRPDLSRDARLAGYLKMGEALFTRRADAEAMLQYQKVLLADPTHPVANKALAFLALRAGEVKKAQTYVEKALQREPRYLEALLIRGYLEARQRQFDRSSRSFDEAAKLATADSEVGQYAKEMAERMRRFSTLE
jgi:Tfp pilus assembly protein PilF